MTVRALLARMPNGLRRRPALGLSPAAAPVMLFVPLGMLLGPSGSGIISRDALGHLDLVVSVTLATLGVFIGLAAARDVRHARRLFAASALEGGLTIAIVGGATLILLRLWGMPLPAPAAVCAAALGVCAAASAAPFVDAASGRALVVAARVADLDDVLPIGAGAMVLSAAVAGGPSPWSSVLLTIALGLTIAIVGWLLLENARDLSERGVFVLGTLALLGGVPAYLGLSPMLAGLAAGWLWVVTPGGCDTLVSAELQKVQHPLVVLVLIAAGASLEPSVAGVWLLVPYVVFRLAGKLVGGWAASRVARGAAPSDLGAYLLPPGAIGVAFALNIAQVPPRFRADPVCRHRRRGCRRSDRPCRIARGARELMRRLTALALTVLLAWLVVTGVRTDAPTGPPAALALGFTLIAAALFGELLEGLRLPRVTGYLLFGMACGPYLANIITRPMARELQLINGLAVVLIAFIAGLEINLAHLRPRIRAILQVGGITMAALYAGLFAAFWVGWRWLGIAPEATGLERVAVVALLTTVVASFSPTVTIALITESRSAGPLCELTLALVIVADLVLILVFTLVMQGVRYAFGGAPDVGLFIGLAWEILGSLAFGAAVGALFALYLRYIGREVVVMMLALCAVVAGAGRSLHFEPLLAALAAGLVIENIARPRGDMLKNATEQGALPVLVVFFAAAGASLQLDALATIGGVAVVIALLRMVLIRTSTRAGARYAGVPPETGGLLWMGLVPQAGVTLGLTLLVSAEFPTWGAPLQTLVVAIVAIHQLVGPVLFRAALARAGELGKAEGEEAPAVDLTPVTAD